MNMIDRLLILAAQVFACAALGLGFVFAVVHLKSVTHPGQHIGVGEFLTRIIERL